MPPLVMHERQGGLLYQTNRMVVRVQQRYARELRVPWGISESAYNARDHLLTYQYSNFGVPSLGLKRDLARNAVIAPYATMLAAQVAPDEAVQNTERLRQMGALGAYGFYEAVDFTPSRLPKGESRAIIRAYFAHHQGMSICAVANVVTGGRLARTVSLRPRHRGRRTAAAGTGAAHRRAGLALRRGQPAKGRWRRTGRSGDPGL